ncbi:putative Ciliary basal body-associated, B9 protein [Leishmania utingensis]|uniref:B9 domain-containing protein 1 n=1 Tax=Leishmania utingensis TaxID=653362 RepID=A0AAW3A1F2_9TRYP
MSTNLFGWPQLVITPHTVKGADDDNTQVLGSGESIIGYGRCFIPMKSGYHPTDMPVMQLESATSRQQLISLLARERPVLRDLSLCTGDDQVMLHARPLDGYVRLSFSVMINGMGSPGFEV